MASNTASALAAAPRRQKILLFREIPPDQLSRLEALHEVVQANPRLPEQQAAFTAALANADALLGSSFRIDAAVLDKAPRLKVISSISVGVDNYDLPALAARNIMLCHTPGVLTETTADTIFALIMASSRRLLALANLVGEGRWTRNISEDLFGWDVHGKTLGIIGFGRIGQALARRAALGFGMPVLYHNRQTVALTGELAPLAGKVVQRTLEQLLAESDIVALVLPLSAASHGLIGPNEFARMKPGAIFINGARGAIVQEPALLDALDHGSLRAAGLDVFAIEPLPLDSRLRNHPKVTALPHIGSATVETRYAMAELATSNLLQALAGERPAAVFEGLT